MLDYCEPIIPSAWHEKEPSWIEEANAERRKRLQEARALAEALVASKVAAIPVEALRPLAERFSEHADKWGRETEHLSSPTQIMMHPSYLAILGMAKEYKNDIVRLMLNDLREHRRPWFWALSYLTEDNPIKPSDAGKLDKMIRSWVEWGKQKGIS